MHNPRLSHGPFDPDERYLTAHEEPFEQGFVPSVEETGAQSGSISPCPKCHFTRIEARNLAPKTGGAVGAVAGSASGIAFALSGAETGVAVGLLAGPAGAMCGAIAGAVIAGLIGGRASCATGSIFGEATTRYSITSVVTPADTRSVAVRHLPDP